MAIGQGKVVEGWEALSVEDHKACVFVQNVGQRYHMEEGNHATR
ncbi:hypothetical protein [Gudongella sp. SC589]